MLKTQNLMCRRKTHRMHRRRIHNPLSPDLKPSKEKIILDKNAGGDGESCEQASSKYGILEGDHSKKIETTSVKEKLVRHHSLDKNYNGLIHKAKMLLSKEKPFNDANQKITKNNKNNNRKIKNIHEQQSRKDPEKKSKKHKSKNKISQLKPCCKIQEVIFCQIEQNPINMKQEKSYSEVKDLYRKIKKPKNPEKEHIILNYQSVRNTIPAHRENMGNHYENPNQEYDAKEESIGRKPQIKDTISESNCLGPDEKYYNGFKSQSIQSNETKKNKKPLNFKIKKTYPLKTESIIEDKIVHKFVKEDLKKISCEIEYIFNRKFEMFLAGYEQLRDKRTKIKERRAKIREERRESEEKKEEIISEVLKRLIYNKTLRPTKTLTKSRSREIRNNKQPNFKKDEIAANSTNKSSSRSREIRQDSPKRPLQYNCGRATHIRKRHSSRKKSEIHFQGFITDSVTRVSEKEKNIDNKSQPNRDKHLLQSASQQTCLGAQRERNEKRNGRLEGNHLPSPKLGHGSEEIHILPPETFRKSQCQLNYCTVPIANILPRSPDKIPFENFKENPIRISSRRLATNSIPSPPKLEHKYGENIFLPPESFSKTQRQLKSATITIINILPKTPYAIQTRSHKGKREASSPRRLGENLIPGPTCRKPQCQLNCCTVPIANILPRSPDKIRFENCIENPILTSSRRLATNSIPSPPKLEHKDEESIFLPPESLCKTQRQLKSATITIINILPKTPFAIQTRSHKGKRDASSPRRLGKNLIPGPQLNHENEEFNILPPKTFRKPQTSLNYCTAPIVSILPKTPTRIIIRSKNHKEKYLQRLSKLRYQNKELLTLSPEMFRTSHVQLNGESLSIINFLPNVANEIQTKNHKHVQKGHSSKRPRKHPLKCHPKPKHEDNKEYIISPPDHFRNSRRRHLKYDTVSIINIWPKILNTFQTQTSDTSNYNKYSVENDLLEKRKQSKRFQSYYKCPIADNNSNGEHFDACSMISDSYKNVYGSGSSEENLEEQPELCLPHNYPVSNKKDFLQLESITEKPSKLSPVSLEKDESFLPLPDSKGSYFRKLISTSSRTDYKTLANSNGLQSTDTDGNYDNVCDKEVKFRPNNELETNPRNDIIITKSDICPNKYKENHSLFKTELVPNKSNSKPNKSAFRTFLEEENIVKAIKQCQTESQENMEEPKENCNTQKQFIEMYQTIDVILERLQIPKLPSVKTIETAVSSAFLNKEYLNENNENFAAIYKIIDNLENNFAEHVETVDAATESRISDRTCSINDKGNYQEMAVGTSQKSSAIVPVRSQRNLLLGTGDLPTKNKLQKPNTFFKSAASSSVKSEKKATVQQLPETSKNQQITCKPLSPARVIDSRSKTAKPKSAASSSVKSEKKSAVQQLPEASKTQQITCKPLSPARVRTSGPKTAKPKTPRAKTPISKNIQDSPNGNNEICKKGTIKIKKSKSLLGLNVLKKVSLKKSKSEENLKDVPQISFFNSQSGVESRAANKLFTKNNSAADEESTYEKRIKYGRELRDKIKKSNKIDFDKMFKTAGNTKMQLLV